MFFYCPPQKMLTVHYSHWGGLGNYLFHLACLLHACAKTGHRPVLLHAQMISLHAMGMNYYKTICARFQPMIDLNRKVDVLIEERQGFTYDEVLIEALKGYSPDTVVCLKGPFQHVGYIPEDFLDWLTLPAFADQQTAFIHLRGGDYRDIPEFMHIHDSGTTPGPSRPFRRTPPSSSSPTT